MLSPRQLRRLLIATFSFATLQSHAATPNQGNWNRDKIGVAGPLLPLEDYTNTKTVGASGFVSLTCPSGSGQFTTASDGGVDYKCRKNLVGSCPTTATDGTACTPRPSGRSWTPDTTYLGCQAVSGTQISISCWKY